jgi:hypothetical protein
MRTEDPNESSTQLDPAVLEKQLADMRQQAIENCRAELAEVLKRYHMNLAATPVVQVSDDGSLKVGSKLDLIPLPQG